MSELLRHAVREPPRKISPIWLVPIVAGLIGAWMLWHNYTTRGVLITIRMETAEGIEPGKTFVRAREVVVGRVVDAELSDGFDYTLVRVRMNPGTQRMLKIDTRFWVVRPRIGAEGISGLNTVLSGSYIQLQPGKAEQSVNEFIALEKPPLAPPGAQGLRIVVTGDRATAASVGDPVEFQGYNVGQVETAEFDVASRQLVCQLFIRAPFDRLVTSNTRFWSGSGLQLRLDASGFSVGVSSFESLLGGGISFGVPEGLAPGEAVDRGARFRLYADEEEARQGTFKRVLQYILLIDGSVRGLAKGAPVEYRGVRVGTVVEVPYDFNHETALSMVRAPIPVLIHIEPQRMGGLDAVINEEAWQQDFDQLIGRGLRASLSAANLLTGSLLVDLDYYDDVPEYQLATYQDLVIIPTVAGGFAELEQQLASLLDKLNQLPLEPVLSHAGGTLQELQRLAANMNSLLGSPETQAMPAQLNQSLAGIAPDSDLYQDLGQTLRQLDTLLRDLQPLVRTLDEKPNALIFNRKDSRDPIPRAAE